MVYNQDTPRMGCVMNLLAVAGIFTPLKFQQFINQMQALTQAMLATQRQHHTLTPQQVLTHDVAPPVLASQPQVIPLIRRQLYYLNEIEKNDTESFSPQ